MERARHWRYGSTVAMQDSSKGQPPQFTQVLARNIRTLVEIRKGVEQRKGWQDRLADSVTRFAGSMAFVWIHAALFGGWVIANLGWIPLVSPWDPSFVVLAMLASVEAIFLSTFVLISQNRMMAESEKRAELDLQISLLAEHEVTQMVELLDGIAKKLQVEQRPDPEIEESKQDVDPAAVMKAIEVGKSSIQEG